MNKILVILLLLSSHTIFAEVNQTTPTTKEVNNLYYQGIAVSVRHGGSYTYIEVKEKTELTFWVAVSQAEVEVGDMIRFQKELVAKDFKSKALNKTFKELMFASNLEYKVSK